MKQSQFFFRLAVLLGVLAAVGAFADFSVIHARTSKGGSGPFTFSVQNVDGLSWPNNPYGLDVAHPGNIVVRFAQEPVVSRGTNGDWVVHFKP